MKNEVTIMASSSRSKWYKILGVLVCVAILLSLASVRVKAQGEAGGDDADVAAMQDYYNSLKQEASDLDKQIKDLNASIAAGQNTAAALQQQRATNQRKADLLAEQIDIKLSQIDLQEKQLLLQQAEIDKTQQEYYDSFELYKERLVAIYKMNNAGVLSTLLNVTSYSELLTVNDTLQRISQHDTDLLDQIQQMQVQLEAQQAELEKQLVELEESRAALAEDLEELEKVNAALGMQISDQLNQVAQNQEALGEAQEARDAMQREIDNVFASLPKSGEAFIGGGDLLWPVAGHEGTAYITSYYGWRTYNYNGQSITEFHTGIDIAKGSQSYIQGKPIAAAMDGTVALVSTGNASSGYGYYVILDHGGGVRTLYAHCDSINVSQGQAVTAGTTIATVGNTGQSTGPHLHFELRLNNTEKVNPLPYLTGEASLNG